MSFRVDLHSVFRGPLDLLLYLVKKHEVEITDIPVGMITEQFLEHLEVLKELDVDAVGDFLDMASHLVELKSRMVLPHGGDEAQVLEDPRDELVTRLLEYKKYKDAASMLEEQSRAAQQRFPRLANDAPARGGDLSREPIQEVELWDLVSAMGRILRDNTPPPTSNIVYDETPIQTHMQRIHQKVASAGRASLSDFFTPGAHKSAMIGLFLAILELVRHHSVRTEQTDLHGEIYILPGEAFAAELKVNDVDDYDRKPVSDEMPVQGR
jgi:segregation and condensation protein A